DNLPDVIKPHCNARDLMQGGDHCYVIDLFGLTAEQARVQHPALYQQLFDRVKPERDHNKDVQRRRDWWLFGRANTALRASWIGLPRLILTPETSKHRVFSFIDRPFCPDHKLYAICLDDARWHGVLSSEVHKRCALRAGGRLGVGNDPTWTNTTCFATFPFPDFHAADKFGGPLSYSVEQTDGRSTEFTTVGEYPSDRIRTLAEQLDTHRKRQQAAHPDLTLTGMYNVLDKLRSGEVLTAKERTLHEHGLVSVLRQLHDDLDAAVLDAYGWTDLLPLLRVAHGNAAVSLLPSGEGARRADEGVRATDNGTLPATGTSTPSHPKGASFGASGAARHLLPEGEGKADAKRAFDDAILERLVALNAERAAEEARGLVRWLRPEFQNPKAATPEQSGLAIDAPQQAETGEVTSPIPFKPKPWPRDTVEQVRAVADTLAATQQPLTVDDIAHHFTGKGLWKKRLPQLLDMLVALGRAHAQGDHYVGRRQP
ncbi:MAG: hypothetical protein LH470_06600, partial [Lysobacter sp.]|nr:hypothetical protein [Lysobacter sp.]